MPSLSPRIDLIDGTRNLWINGALDFAQRGTAFSALNVPAANYTAGITNNQYIADRIKYENSSSVVDNLGGQVLISGGPTAAQSGFNFLNTTSCIDLYPTTAVLSPGTTNYNLIRYTIEGYDYQQLHGMPFRVQFWVKSNITGVVSVAFRNNGTTRHCIKTVTINAANTWEKKTVDVIGDTAGTWLFDSSAGCRVDIVRMVGSDFSTPNLDQWYDGNKFCASTQTNFCATVGTHFYITGFQIIPGNFVGTSADIPFFRAGRTIGQELAMCQRYYEKSYDVGTAPGSVSGDTSEVYYHAGLTASTTLPTVIMKVSKRAYTSDIVVYTPLGVAGSIRNASDSTDLAASISLAAQRGFALQASTTQNKTYHYNWVYSADY